MKKNILLFVLVICRLVVYADNLYETRFSVYSDSVSSKLWTVDNSAITKGKAWAMPNGNFEVSNCVGTLVFATIPINLNGFADFNVSFRTGEYEPVKAFQFDMSNVSGNRIVFTEIAEEGHEFTASLIVNNDSLQIVFTMTKLTEQSVFCFSDIVVSVEVPLESRLLCDLQDDMLKIAAGDTLLFPLRVYNEGDSDMKISAIELTSDSSIMQIIDNIQLKDSNGEIFKPTVFGGNRVRFYNRNGLLSVLAQDSCMFEIELIIQKYFVEDRKSLKLEISTIDYAENSETIDVKNICQLPEISLDIKLRRTRTLDYNLFWQRENTLYLANCDDFGNIDKDTVVKTDILIYKDNQQYKKFSTEVEGIKKVQLDLEENDNYQIVIGDYDTVNILGVSPEIVYSENFDNMPDDWYGSENWSIDDGWLRHAVSSGSSTTFFMKHFPVSFGSKRCYEWNFSIAIGDWSPSSTNYFRYFLLSDSLNNQYYKALYFTTDSKTDLPMLIKDVKNTKDTLWIGGRKWYENEEYSVKIVYLTSGFWEISMYPSKGETRLLSKLCEPLGDEFEEGDFYSGLLFRNSTASYSDKLRLDDVSFLSGMTERKMLSMEVVDNRMLKMYYPCPLKKEVAVLHENYSLFRDSVAYPIDSIIVTNADSSVVLLYSNFITGNYILDIKELEDVVGNVIDASVNEFSCLSIAGYGDIVLNEIMYKPSDGMILPKVEYLELLNIRDYPLLLDSIFFYDRGERDDIICDTIDGNGYLLLGGSNIALLEEYGRTHRMKNFSLIDAGADIVLKNKNGTVLDSVNYLASWVRDESKRKTGGYSLEKMYPENLYSSQLDWYESQDPKGGTPGEVNSVYYNCPDSVAPEIISFCFCDNITLYFSEPLYSQDVRNTNNYSLDHSYGHPDSVVVQGLNVQLIFDDAPEKGVEYILTVKDIRDLNGNKMEETQIKLFQYPEPQVGDILINELLFDADPTNAEFVELLNVSDKTFLVSDLWIAKRNSSGSITDKKNLSSIAEEVYANGLIWACYSPEDILSNFTYNDPTNYYVTANRLSYSNTSGTIVVLNRSGVVIDEFSYSNKLHNSMLTNTKNVSLERISYTLPTSDPAAWTSAAGDEESGFASPGMSNRSSLTINEIQSFTESNYLQREPEVFTPDGNGFEDELQIVIELPETDFSVKLLIYNSYGILVKEITNGLPAHSKISFAWDGTNAQGNLMPAGIYVIYVDILESGGRHRIDRKACVLSK
ncbi:MAG: gliding motility-associated C-terminal domain-containing protein [Culturomica sp.]|jgi:hypothetical protein|nr:gliding motility-associated C-terminal domain-containing protein [Culturomica sp.]